MQVKTWLHQGLASIGGIGPIGTLVAVYQGQVTPDEEDLWAYILLDLLVLASIFSFTMLVLESFGRWRMKKFQQPAQAEDAPASPEQLVALQGLLQTYKDLDAYASMLMNPGQDTSHIPHNNSVKQLVVQLRDVHTSSFASMQQLLNSFLALGQSSPILSSLDMVCQAPALRPGTSPTSSLASSSPSFGPSPGRPATSAPLSPATSPTSAALTHKPSPTAQGSTGGGPDVHPGTDQQQPASQARATHSPALSTNPAAPPASALALLAPAATKDDSPNKDMDVLARGYRQAAAAIAAAGQEGEEVQPGSGTPAGTPAPAAQTDGAVLVHTMSAAAAKTAAPPEDESKYQICGFRSPWLGISRRPISRRYIDYVGRSCGGAAAASDPAASTTAAANTTAHPTAPLNTTTAAAVSANQVSAAAAAAAPAAAPGRTSTALPSSSWSQVYEDEGGLSTSCSPLASPLLPGPPRLTDNVRLFLPVPPGGLVRSPSYQSWSQLEQQAACTAAQQPQRQEELVCVPDIIPFIPLATDDDSTDDDDDLCLPGAPQRLPSPRRSPKSAASPVSGTATPGAPPASPAASPVAASPAASQLLSPQSPQAMSPGQGGGGGGQAAPGTPGGQGVGEQGELTSPAVTPSKRSSLVVGVV